MTLRILVLYCLSPGKKIRKTVDDHLYCFKRYTQGVQYHYFNAVRRIPRYLSLIPYDGVILHYTLLAMRWDQKNFPRFMESIGNLKYIKAPKVALPQDEYAHTHDLWRMFKIFDVKTVFTLADKRAYPILYPLKKTGLLHRFTVFPGYVDERTLTKIKRLSAEQRPRSIDIGYRARKVPYWLGRYAQTKYSLGEVVKKYCQKYTDLTLDISTDVSDVMEKDNWMRFLLRCKAVLGCEGGATVWDPDGSIRKRVELFLSRFPQSGYKEVEKACFKGKDGALPYLTISPRHFEAAMTKTCQILVEGKYSDILQSNVHYIPLKPDFTNLAEAIQKLQDRVLRARIVEQTYRDLVLSGKYSYRRFAGKVIEHLRMLTSLTHRDTPSLGLRFSLFGLLINLHMLLIAGTDFTRERLFFVKTKAERLIRTRILLTIIRSRR